jgi:superfamily II DNA/RNA helicase
VAGPEGRATIIKIIKELVPEWDEGLHMWQLDFVVRILDGEDILCCTAMGDGKSALFAAPIIVLQEMARNPGQYLPLPPSRFRRYANQRTIRKYCGFS